MIFVKRLVARMIMLSTTTVVTFIIYIATAVAAPSLMRAMQTGVDRLLSMLEVSLEIPAQYMVWAQMADVNSKLVFVAFYIFTFFGLIFVWAFLKRLTRRTGQAFGSLFKRPKKTKPAT